MLNGKDKKKDCWMEKIKNINYVIKSNIILYDL